MNPAHKWWFKHLIFQGHRNKEFSNSGNKFKMKEGVTLAGYNMESWDTCILPVPSEYWWREGEGLP